MVGKLSHEGSWIKAYTLKLDNKVGPFVKEVDETVDSYHHWVDRFPDEFTAGLLMITAMVGRWVD